jgi:hypothetical protein
MMNPKPREKGSKSTFGNPDLYDNEHTSSCIFKACGGAVQAV